MATNAGCGLLVVSFSPSGTGARKDRPSISWVAFSWRPEPPGAEARPQRPPRRSAAAAALHRSVCVNQLVGGHPVGRTRRTRTGRIILAKICRLASLALPPAGRVVEPGGVPEPVRWADCTSRLGLRGTAADSGLQSVQTGGQAADPRQTGRQRGAGLQSVPAYTDITMDSVQCLTSPHENPFHFRLHFCIPAKQICQSWMQSGSRCGQ